LSNNIHLSQSRTENFDVSKIRNRICAIITIASKCGQPVTYDEIALMLPSTPPPVNLREFVNSDPSIFEKITVQGGFIVLRGYERLFLTRKHKLSVSLAKLLTAKEFAILLLKSRSYIKILAVSGSVAYGTATENDDIDLFIITQNDRMWLAFAKSLLLARAMNTKESIHGKSVNFCLSYILDEKTFKEIASHQTLLFAREFLSAKLLAGQENYYAILSKEQWIKNCLPALYLQKLLKKDPTIVSTEGYSSSKLLSGVNMLLYVLLGNYLRFKAFLRNLSYKKKGLFPEVFEAKITKGSCLYNSKRYQLLERIYSQM
jgi:hypothetical protein